MKRINYKDLNPVIRSTAVIECSGCENMAEYDLEGIDPRKQIKHANGMAWEEGWRVRIPKGWQFMGTLCPTCVISYAKGGDAYCDANGEENGT